MMAVNTLSSCLFKNTNDNKLYYSDGNVTIELSDNLPELLEELRNCKREIRALRAVAEAAKALIDFGYSQKDKVFLLSALKNLDEARRG
jgi:hypothetical protein